MNSLQSVDIPSIEARARKLRADWLRSLFASKRR